ncbi:MAG: acetyltransferase [Pseudomonadota bacterium]
MVMSKQLVIVGFSGFGKEVYWLASRLGLRVRGFLDDNTDVQGQTFGAAEVLGKVSEWVNYSDCQFVIAVGNPRVRHVIYKKMISLGAPVFACLVDPSAIVQAADVQLGPGSIVCAGTICTVDVVIGSHVIINLNCTVGHEVVIGDFVTVAPMVAISGNVTIAAHVEIGTGSSIRQGLSLETGSMLGMGSVLTKDIKENMVFLGNPARAYKMLSAVEA